MLSLLSLVEPALTLMSAPAAKSKSLFHLATQSFPGVVFWVLCLLVIFSVICWYIIGFKYFFLRRAERASDQFLELFWQSKRLDAIFKSAEELPQSPTAQVFRAGFIELSKLQQQGKDDSADTARENRMGDLESVERAMRRAHTAELTRLESSVAFLATTGSAAPFVGLFGTVWGIMTSFRDITAKGSASVAVVAPGIAEALIATAIGLMAAIPAVIAYNLFVSKIKVVSSEMETFESDFLNIVKRHVLK